MPQTFSYSFTWQQRPSGEKLLPNSHQNFLQDYDPRSLDKEKFIKIFKENFWRASLYLNKENATKTDIDGLCKNLIKVFHNNGRKLSLLVILDKDTFGVETLDKN